MNAEKDSEACQMISIIQIEIARQVIRAGIARIAAVAGTLLGGKKLDGHKLRQNSLRKPSFVHQWRECR